MNILIACDKFKGSLSATAVCNAIRYGLRTAHSTANIICCPLADGGDGTMDILQEILDLRSINIDSVDALGRPIKAQYNISPDTAYIELAQASGITRLRHKELDALNAHAFGTGLLMRHAINHGIKKIVLGIGGSASTECGLSIAHALGWTFLDQQGEAIVPSGGKLNYIVYIEPPTEMIEIELTVLCDVNNPLFGPTGAAYVYGPQKGATEAHITTLDRGLRHIAQLIQQYNDRDLSTLIGGGAAGGVAAGLYGLMEAKVISGFDYLSSLLHLDDLISRADLVITGEGRLDEQSLSGKVVGSIAQQCRQHKTLLYAVVGENQLSADLQDRAGIKKVYAVMDRAIDTKDARKHAEKYLREIVKIMEL